MVDKKTSKVILITGCSKGLGRFLAEFLDNLGFKVFAGLRQESDLDRMGSEWQSSHSQVRRLKLDVTRSSDCREAVSLILEEEGKIDVLINNAAYQLRGPASDFPAEILREVLETTVVGTFRLIQEVLPSMRRQGGGRIVNITSLNGRLSFPNFGLYCASKFALEALGLCLRYELRKEGIWVTNVAPGAIVNSVSSEGVKNQSGIREKIWLVKKILPLTTPRVVGEAILEVIKSSRPPGQILVGRDAKLMVLLQRCLPQSWWEWLLFRAYGL